MRKWLSPVNRLIVVHFLLEAQFWFPIWFIFLQDKGFDISLIVLADVFFRVVLVALEVPLGIVGDWLGRKRTYLLTIFFGILTYFLNVLVWNTTLLLIAWACWGLFRALASGTDVAYRYEIIISSGEAKRVTQILGRFQAVTAVTLLISQLAAGWLYAISPGLPFLINGLFAVASLLLALSLPDPAIEDERIVGDPLSQNNLKTIYGILKNNPIILIGISSMALIMMYFWTPTLLFQLLLTEQGFEPAWFGVVFVLFSGVGMVASLVTHRVSERLGNTHTVLLSAVILLIASALIAFAPGLVGLSGMLLLSAGFYLSTPALETIVNRELNDVNRATLLSVGSLMSNLLMIATRPGLGLLAQESSVRGAFRGWLVVGVVVLAVVTWGTMTIGRLQKAA